MNTTAILIPISSLKDADMHAAPAALVRAAQRAREIAVRTGTPLIVTQNGELVEKAVTSDMNSTVARAI